MLNFAGKEGAAADAPVGQEARNVIHELAEHGADQVPESERLHRVPERLRPELAEEVQLHRVAEGCPDE